jgi:hypothetical protein
MAVCCSPQLGITRHLYHSSATLPRRSMIPPTQYTSIREPDLTSLPWLICLDTRSLQWLSDAHRSSTPFDPRLSQPRISLSTHHRIARRSRCCLTPSFLRHQHPSWNLRRCPHPHQCPSQWQRPHLDRPMMANLKVLPLLQHSLYHIV